jgi:hypothetical protein
LLASGQILAKHAAADKKVSIELPNYIEVRKTFAV